MARQRTDAATMDLLTWERAETLVSRYDDRQVRTVTLRSKIARAVAETLREADKAREQIAQDMTEWLGEDVTKNMLDAYASEAREDHTIPFLRLLALVHVTGDTRPLQLGAEQFGCAVVEDRYLPWVEAGQLAEVRDKAEQELQAARRRARKGVRG